MTNRYLRVFALTLVVATVLAGCASTGSGSSSEVESAAERAQQRWDLLIAGDYAGAYEYLSPGYRSSTSLNNYQRRLLLRRVSWKTAEVLESNCTGDRCEVKIGLNYAVNKPLPGVSSFDGRSEDVETWVRTENQWWLLPEK